jgi:hypothetical protein
MGRRIVPRNVDLGQRRPYAAGVARYDRCPNCEGEMPVGNLHCFGCGEDLPPPKNPDGGSVLVQLYPADTQAEAFKFYQVEARRLADAGWYPIAHSWGDERPGTGMAAVFGYVAESVGWGTLLVTYRYGGRA